MILGPRPRIELTPSALEGEILTTGPLLLYKANKTQMLQLITILTQHCLLQEAFFNFLKVILLVFITSSVSYPKIFLCFPQSTNNPLHIVGAENVSFYSSRFFAWSNN